MKKIFSAFIAMLAILVSSCTNDALTVAENQEMGYLTLSIKSVSTTYNNETRAVPSEYNAKQLYVEIVNSKGEVVKSTHDHTQWLNTNIKLPAGTYTIKAHSNDWDGNDSGRDIPYYAGSATVQVVAGEQVEAKVTCSLANVKVSVKFDDTVVKAFRSAVVEVSSAVSGIANQSFTMSFDATMSPAYFPVGKLMAKLTVINFKGETFTMESSFTDVKARDHFILNYTTSPTGDGSFTVVADGTETQYNYVFSVPTSASTVLLVNDINAWSNFAWVEGSIPTVQGTIDNQYVKFQYKADTDADWTTTDATFASDVYKATIKSLKPGANYLIKLTYDDGIESFSSPERTFKTEGATLLPNGNLDNWCTGKFNNKDCTYPSSLADYNAGNGFWDTSNPGSSLLNKMVTSEEKTDVHTPGGSAARLGSQFIVIKFAAASLYAGSFGSLKGTNGAVINFGQPWSDRPTQLKGWFKYSGGAINQVSGAPAGVTITKGV
ncbi:MAG: DUF4493 domain-containing protein, partial [Bacteroidaceae bacterium]|nr:DUF4493 domain-containing protein [Bacteroidaceae bacterium]